MLLSRPHGRSKWYQERRISECCSFQKGTNRNIASIVTIIAMMQDSSGTSGSYHAALAMLPVEHGPGEPMKFGGPATGKLGGAMPGYWMPL